MQFFCFPDITRILLSNKFFLRDNSKLTSPLERAHGVCPGKKYNQLIPSKNKVSGIFQKFVSSILVAYKTENISF